jgi:hypothetical protein
MQNQTPQRIEKASKYKGVSHCNSKINPWAAYINEDYQKHHLGVYPTEEKAARAYNRAAKERFGQFACLNKIPRKPKQEIPESIKKGMEELAAETTTTTTSLVKIESK